MQMQDTIRKTMENVIIRSKKEVDAAMTTNIVETLPWIDYREAFERLEERGRAEGEAKGKAEGKAERDMEIALKAFGSLNLGESLTAITNTLKELGIPDNAIESARKQTEADRAQRAKGEPEPER